MPAASTTLLHLLQDVRGARLLALLDALIARDGSAPALGGRVSVGVRCDDGQWVFWRATPEVRRATTELFAAAPPADVTPVVDADVAEAILGTGSPPQNPAVMTIDGNRTLFKQFAQRSGRDGWPALQAATKQRRQQAGLRLTLARHRPRRAQRRACRQPTGSALYARPLASFVAGSRLPAALGR